MGQVLHGCATTTHTVRAALQRSKAALKDLAAQHGLNSKMVAKWRKRAFVHDAAMGPKRVCQELRVRAAIVDPTEVLDGTSHSLPYL